MKTMGWKGISRGRNGFTLIELMTVVALLAVLLALTVPSFRSQMQRWRVMGEAGTFVGDLQYARSEAIRRGQATSLCVSADGQTCLDSDQWQRGWIVLSDPTATGTGTSVLRVRAAWKSGDSLVAPSGLSRVSFTGDGFASNLTAGTVTLPLRTSPVNSNATRCVSLSLAGRIEVLTPGAACS